MKMSPTAHLHDRARLYDQRAGDGQYGRALKKRLANNNYNQESQ